MPREVVPIYYTMLVNRALRKDYSIDDIRTMMQDEYQREDLELTLELRKVLFDRISRSLKRPDAQKNPERALLVEILSQLI